MKIHLLQIILLAVILTATTSFAQSVHLNNPSFEDEPTANKVPQGWTDCGSRFRGETPPDVQPSGAWSVTIAAKDGKTYVGMVVRENNTWESLAQKLIGILKKDTIYHFEILMCTSEKYLSATRATAATAINGFAQKVNYTTPAKLRIWGGNDICYPGIILAESPLIKNNDWELYRFTIKPSENVSFIILEAYYESEESKPYNGNILIDGASAFTVITK